MQTGRALVNLMRGSQGGLWAARAQAVDAAWKKTSPNPWPRLVREAHACRVWWGWIDHHSSATWVAKDLPITYASETVIYHEWVCTTTCYDDALVVGLGPGYRSQAYLARRMRGRRRGSRMLAR